MTDEIKVGRLARDLFGAEVQITRAADEPMRLSFPASSELPVERWFGTEVLRHDDKSIRMDRLKGGAAPLLFNHNWDDPVGMIDTARVKDGRLWVDAHFFDTPRAKEVAAMVEGGMRNVSIGYELYEVVEDTKRNQFTATDWGVLEVSFATVPADPTVGVGRSKDDAAPVRVVRSVSPSAQAITTERKAAMADQQAAAGVNAEPSTAQAEPQQRSLPAQPRQAAQEFVGQSAVEFERNRKRGIENLCTANKIDANLRDYWIGSGLSIDAITDDLLKVLEERGKNNPQSDAKLGLTDKEVGRYSIFNAIRAVADKNWNNATFELEASRAIAQKLGRSPDPHKFYVPFEVQQRQLPQRRDLTVASGSGGGYLVATENMSFIELLRNRSVAFRMGARRLSGLTGSVTVPKQTAGATAVWLSSESATATESAQTFGQMALSPKTVGAYTEISRQLLLQSSPDAESIVTMDLATVCGLAVDVGVLRGSGSSGEPTGIITTSGVGTVSGTSFDYADILEFQSDVAAANVIPVAGGYVTTPAVAALAMARQRFSSTDTPLWEGNLWNGQMAGFPAMSSNQMASGTMLFGDWSQVVVGEWGVLEVEVNPYANFQAGIIGIRALVSMDVGLRYAAAFSYGAAMT
jgi:HK97 family phage major capsid protein/HK97 family phage prohead protease